MSRTYRKVIHWAKGEMADLLRRGHISIPKRDDFDDDIWGQKGKKHRKKILSRRQRRSSSCTNEGNMKQKFKVQFEVRYEVEIECELDDLENEIANLNILEEDQTRYVTDTFEVFSIEDESGNEIEV